MSRPPGRARVRQIDGQPGEEEEDDGSFYDACTKIRDDYEVYTGPRGIVNRIQEDITSHHYRQSASVSSASSSIVSAKVKAVCPATPSLNVLVVRTDFDKRVPVCATPDTGAFLTVINESILELLGIGKKSVKKSPLQLFHADGKSRLQSSGIITLNVSYLDKNATMDFVVAPGIKDQMLVYWHHMKELGLLSADFPGCVGTVQVKDSIEAIKADFDDRPMTIELRKDIPIVPLHVNVARPIPLHLALMAWIVVDGLAEAVGDVLGQECKRYEKRFEAFANSLQDGQLNQDEFRNNFYRFVTYPAKHHCKNLQRFGGRWIANRAWDGQKFACLDNFDKESLCIIYSFGLNRDWSFEQTFANLGCQVFGYDHTIKFPPLGKIISPNFTIYGLGVDKASHDQFTSLQDAMKKHNHEKSYIKYIKADIEGAELKVLPEWISSGILEHVEQIGFEFHIRAGNIRKFAQIIVDLKQQGFHLISFDPNAFVGLTNHQYQCFEVVFKKLEGNCFDF
eukprot:maker-scaffold1035_size68272-snap-gene-0.13 protein:Tk07533 transcript:maker-scaffold1035_size68272-snap-gene-0.13-mRNA-1 annotation:"hypothetical protein DAPPUDRAFT_239346"